MSQSQKVCYSCRKPLISMSSYYCCNPHQISCFKCSNYPCSKCKNQKNVFFQSSGLRVNKIMVPSDISRENRCDNCNSSEPIAKHKFYQEKKCKKYYCHTCMEIFYTAYKNLLNSFMKDNGVALQIQVELRCGCDIPQSQIIAYLRKYCIDCSEQITKKSIVLTNNCIIMVECIRKLENQFMSTKYNASKKNQLGQVLRHIKSLIAVCTVCDMKIDGSLRTEWEMIDNMCICSFCLQSSKEKQQFYVSSGKKRKGERQQPRKHQQIIIQKEQIKKCKSCRLGLKKSDQQNDLCEICTIKHLKSIKQQPKQSFQQIKINRIPNKQLQRQKQKQDEQLSSPLKSKINDPQFPNQSSSKKSKPQLSSPIKEHYNQQEIPDQQYISFPSQSNIQRAALQSENISFKLQFSQEDMPQSKCCCQCKCIFEDILITYKRQKDRQQTIRIAQLPEQIAKYTKQNRIQIYCKSCYLQLKFKIKLNKSNDVFRRVDVRRTGSMPKPPVKNVNTQSKYRYLGGDYDNIYDPKKYDKKEDEIIKCTKCKIKLVYKPINKEGLCIKCQQDRSTKTTDRLLFCSQCNNFIEMKDQQSNTFKQKLCQLCLQRKSLKSNQIRCEKCKYYKPQQQFKMNLLICKQCEKTQLYSPIQKKQQQKYIEYICKKCKKIEKVKQSQKGKSIHCTNCLMNSHTAQHRARFT